MAKNRRKLEGFPESFLGVFISVIKDKGDVFSGEYRKGSCDTTIVFNKTTVKVTKTKVTLYPSHVIGVSPVLYHVNLLRVYLYTINFNNKA